MLDAIAGLTRIVECWRSECGSSARRVAALELADGRVLACRAW